jgi:hypothetical protein
MSKKSRATGSITFGTSIMKTDEVVLFAKACMKEGMIDPEEINRDLHFVDECLQLSRVRYFSRAVNRTAAGNLRKDANLQGLLMNRLDHYMKEEEMSK